MVLNTVSHFYSSNRSHTPAFRGQSSHTLLNIRPVWCTYHHTKHTRRVLQCQLARDDGRNGIRLTKHDFAQQHVLQREHGILGTVGGIVPATVHTVSKAMKHVLPRVSRSASLLNTVRRHQSRHTRSVDRHLHRRDIGVVGAAQNHAPFERLVEVGEGSFEVLLLRVHNARHEVQSGLHLRRAVHAVSGRPAATI